MGYWLSAVSMKVFGETNFAGRLPQALAVGLSALFIFFVAARFGGGPQTGTIAALIYMSCLEVFAVGVFNTLDSLLSFFLTASLASFFMAWDRREKKNEIMPSWLYPVCSVASPAIPRVSSLLPCLFL